MPNPNKQYGCVICKVESGDENKYGVIVTKDGVSRILLKATPAYTLFICPKCRQQHITREFKLDEKQCEELDVQRQQSKKKRRTQALRILYHPFLGV